VLSAAATTSRSSVTMIAAAAVRASTHFAFIGTSSVETPVPSCDPVSRANSSPNRNLGRDPGCRTP
jgi:hypothetical protein